MRKVTWILLSVLLIATVLLSACAAPAATPVPAAAPTDTPAPTTAPTSQPTATARAWKACFLYGSVIGDAGWTYAQDQGRKFVEKKYGIQTIFAENVPSGADAERMLAQFAEQGCNQIITTTNLHSKAVDTVAPKYPNVIFEAYDALNIYPNLRSHRLRLYEGYYLAGILAGKMTKNGQAGWVAGFAAPSFPSQANSMLLGARSVNPDFKLSIVFMNTWGDPPREKQAAESLIAAGSQFLTNSMSSPTVIQAAETAGVYSLGRTEQCSFGPKYCLASVVVNWKQIYDKLISSAMNGTWSNKEVYWATAGLGEIGLAELHSSVPADVKAQLDQTAEQLKSGELVLWKGPIKDQTGAVKVPEGKTLAPAELVLIDWFVEGVQTPAK